MKFKMKALAATGILAGALLGVTGSLESAQALPAAHVTTPAADAPVTTVQYYRYGYYGRYGHRRYRGPAGVYRCGPYQLHTHLQRKACR